MRRWRGRGGKRVEIYTENRGGGDLFIEFSECNHHFTVYFEINMPIFIDLIVNIAFIFIYLNCFLVV